MAPKLVKVSSLGSLVQQANGNWRVRAQVDGKKYQGPWRATREQAHDDRTKARRATTRSDFVGIVQSLSRGGRPASSSQPQKRARKICETLSSGGAYRAAMQAPSTLSTKRLRRKTPVPNCASASSSRFTSASSAAQPASPPLVSKAKSSAEQSASTGRVAGSNGQRGVSSATNARTSGLILAALAKEARASAQCRDSTVFRGRALSSSASESPDHAENAVDSSSASSSRGGPPSPQAREHLQVGWLRHKPATAAGVPSASGGGVGEPTANSVSVIASLLQAATGPPSFPSAGHDDHVDNHGHDHVDSRHGHEHEEHNGHERDHDERDSNVVAFIPSINAKAAPKLRRSCADENGCGRCFCETCYW